MYRVIRANTSFTDLQPDLVRIAQNAGCTFKKFQKTRYGGILYIHAPVTGYDFTHNDQYQQWVYYFDSPEKENDRKLWKWKTFDFTDPQTIDEFRELFIDIGSEIVQLSDVQEVSVSGTDWDYWMKNGFKVHTTGKTRKNFWIDMHFKISMDSRFHFKDGYIINR